MHKDLYVHLFTQIILQFEAIGIILIESLESNRIETIQSNRINQINWGNRLNRNQNVSLET